MKQKITYEVKETTLDVNEEEISSYGIDCLVDGKKYLSVEDISTDKRSVEDLARICSALELEPEHLRDVAEDYIS